MRIKLPCGRETITAELPTEPGHQVHTWSASPAPGLADEAGALRQALAAPLAGPPLARLAQGKASACVVVSDATRPAPNRLMLPAILAALEQAGVPRGGVTILIATGMHPPTQGQALAELVGDEVLANWRVVNHDCRDQAALRQVDEIDGWPITINRAYLDAEVKVLTGLIEPHPFAGYSGGGKSVLPGLAGFESMRLMHSHALVAHPRVQAARLAGNPFQDHVRRVMGLAGADFLVNATINQARQVTGVFAGQPLAAHDAGCAQAARHVVIAPEAPATLVITTGGGHPLDATLYQSSKGLATATGLLERGGEVLWVTGCADGLGGDAFCRMVAEAGCPEEFTRVHSDPDNFTIDQWGAQVYFQSLAHAGSVLLYSPGVTARQAEDFVLVKVDDLDAALARLAARHRSIHIIPQGPYLAAAPHDPADGA